ncbi:MAG: PLP-dependent aminotransferase family protein [bacterium]
MTTQFSRLAQRTHPPEISWLMAQALEVPDLISLAVGFVDQGSLPNRLVASEMAVMLESSKTGPAALQYGTTQGDLDLRTRLVEKLTQEQIFHPRAGIRAEHLLLGSGSQQILYLLSETLLDEGDIVLVEAPTYFVVLGAFQSRGARTVGIDTDEQGLVPESLLECLQVLERSGELSRVKFLYVMTYSTNPLGVTLPEERRTAIVDILRRYQDKGAPILFVEDAAYRRLSYRDQIPAPVKYYDENNDFVLYTESFSKSFAPGLRLGFAVGPKPLIDKMVDIKGNHDFGSSNLSQQLLKRILQTDTFEKQIRNLRKVYAHKCDQVMEVLKDTFPPEAGWTRPDGGFYTWITLPDAWDTGGQSELFQQALRERVLYVPGNLCYSPDRAESKQSSSIRLAYGMISEKQLTEGCERLAHALNAVAAPV